MITKAIRKSKESEENKQKYLTNQELGAGNTQLKPVLPHEHGKEHERKYQQNKGVSYFIDYLTIFGERMKLSMRQVEFMVDQFLLGKFWLTPESYHREVEDLKVRKYDCYKETRPASGRKWHYCYENSLGAKIFISHHEVNGCVDENLVHSIKFDFSGSVLSALFPRNNQIKLIEMMDCISSLDKKIHATRIDTTMEFGHNLLDLQKIKDAVDNQDFSGVKKAEIIYEVDAVKGRQYPTIYFGSPKSDKRIRIYETTEKHKYEGLRIESQNRGKYAGLVITDLRAMYNDAMGSNILPTDLADNINNYIRDFNLSKRTFNLVDKNTKASWKRAEDYKELPFWTKFKNSLQNQELDYRFEPKKPTVQKNIRWIMRQVSGALRVLKNTLGKEYSDKLMRYLMKINEAKYKQDYSPTNQVIFGQIKDMGAKINELLFDDETRKLLREVGFFENPCYPKEDTNHFNIFNFEYARRQPRDYEPELQF